MAQKLQAINVVLSISFFSWSLFCFWQKEFIIAGTMILISFYILQTIFRRHHMICNISRREKIIDSLKSLDDISIIENYGDVTVIKFVMPSITLLEELRQVENEICQFM